MQTAILYRASLLFVLASGVVASSAQASVIWRGDYSTGDLSQWTGSETVGNGRLSVVPAPSSTGQALRAIVEQGDNPIASSGNRNELFYQGDDVSSGTAERWYRWQTYWPSDYESADTWQLFTQWHQYSGGGSPPMEFFVWGEQLELIVNNATTPIWTAPLQRGMWHDFVFHVNWSTDPSVGFVELYYDGKPVLPRQATATLYSGGGGAYLKQGLYRDATISQTQTVYHRGMVIGSEQADVVPPPPAPPAAAKSGVPSPGSPTTSTGSQAASNSAASASATDVPLSGTSGPGSGAAHAAGCQQVEWESLLACLPIAGAFIWRRRRRTHRTMNR